ncbi:MAG: pilus assembly protein TadG-related protein [Porticoccaceae bacterium]|nr:pilus assembly protein TadG-related protein [Porticoccaceae bacterium]
MEKCNRRPTSRHHQQGAFAVLFAIVLAAFALMLVLVLDSGRLYLEKRSLQRVADMAALEAVSRKGSCLVEDDADNYAATLVQQAAARNQLFSSGGDIIAVTCVDLTTNADGVREVSALNDASPIIQVITGKTVPASLVIRAGCLFDLCASDSVTLQASAVAGSEEPIAAFSVGSRLIRFDSESVLAGVLGLVGLDVDELTVGSYEGLANVDITPDGLLKELGLPITTDLTVGGLNDLLATEEVNVLDLIAATATVAGQSELLDLGVDILNALKADTGIDYLNLTLPLLTQEGGPPGLFAEIIAPDSQSASSALSTELSALGILETAIGIATREHALSVDRLNINLLGLVEVETKVGVVEPPSITIGAPTKRDASGQVIREGAKAYTAQVRTYIRVKTGDLVETLNSLVSILGLGNLIHIDLPISLDLVTGQGVLEENTCTPFAAQQTGNTDRDHAEIAASGTVGALCIGLPRDESQLFSKHASCDSYMAGTNYLDILGLLKLDRTGGSPLSLNLLDIPEEKVYLSLDHTNLPPDWSEMAGRTDFATVGSNSLNIGTLVEGLVNLLLNALIGESTVSVSDEQNKVIAQEIWDSVEPAECGNRQCRKAKIEEIEELAEASSDSLGGLLGGLLGLVGDLLSGLLGVLLGGDGCVTNSGLLGLGGTSDGRCVALIADELPSNSNPTTENHFGLGILKSLLDELGDLVLRPILEDLLGLRVSEVDVHLQDLNCGHAKLLL